MLKYLMTWFGVDMTPSPPTNDNDIIRTFIGEINQHKEKTFSSAKARSCKLRVHEETITSLRPLLLQSTQFVSKKDYVPENWKIKILVPRDVTLDNYITENKQLVHPVDWIASHSHNIIKLLNALEKMEESEREYYQRHCNFVVKDLASFIKSVLSCLY